LDPVSHPAAGRERMEMALRVVATLVAPGQAAMAAELGGMAAPPDAEPA
jgi:hypothetical protein